MVRTLVFGSCVSRDTFEYLEPHGFELLQYVARQSVISSYGYLHPRDFPEVSTSSRFQRRMIVGDWTSSLRRVLDAHADSADLLLWDLFDERLGVHRIHGDRYATRSIDGISSGLDEIISTTSEHLPFGTPEHLVAFTGATRRLAVQLERLGLRDRTLVLAPAWAEQRDDGQPVPPSFGLDPRTANELTEPYLQQVHEVVGAPIVRIPRERVLGAGEHQWGPAPFHYTPAVYEELRDAVRAFVGQVR